jgi:transcriptional regulator with XRE-family HTH domain
MNPRPVEDLHFSRVLAENMRRLRLERGISAAALAGIIKADGHRMSERSIHQFEWNCTKVPRAMTVDHLMWLAKALDAPFASLLSEREAGS